ncbi:MAG TPA: nucleotidyltransferase family protein [Sphingorhabdus sp.]|uniref:nucleotidyltransferase family protein n=1 Tax=Sphingorhabdus sp. TaxID=1902408 RepID=UPI002C5D18E8|nr:nucleotidyltransferase family protein [Sphingorhabdus sp.]HQS12199.1 nucleotidyltransferase family protein [Sphingorhabdus sp.]HQS79601.1 nucleotidyltransferase family protein [Sphingorhabdus sp.]
MAIVLLAAGNARRFGSDKLMADFEGRPLGARAGNELASIAAAAHFAVCQPEAHIAAYYKRLGFDIVDNPNPGIGLSGSLHLAVEAALRTDAQALLIALADMPFVQAAHVEALIAACTDTVVASFDGHQPMPPAIFPRGHWPDLLATAGDAGARHILAGAEKLTAPAGTLCDIDTADDLAASKVAFHRIDRLQ